MAPAKPKLGKPIFKGLVFVLHGELHPNYDHARIAGWINTHGGEVQKDVSEETTHLVTTLVDYKRGVRSGSGPVSEARELGEPKCKIVVYAYLEDCLCPEMRKRKRRAEKPYLCRVIMGRGYKVLEAKKQHVKTFEEGVTKHQVIFGNKKVKRWIKVPLTSGVGSPGEPGHIIGDDKLFHIYVDSTGFEYRVVLTRMNSTKQGIMDRFVIYLFESNATCPSFYKVGTEERIGTKPPSYRPEISGAREFHHAFATFRQIFKTKTGYEWDMRVRQTGMQASAGSEEDMDAWRYCLPGDEKPIGRVIKEPIWSGIEGLAEMEAQMRKAEEIKREEEEMAKGGGERGDGEESEESGGEEVLSLEKMKYDFD